MNEIRSDFINFLNPWFFFNYFFKQERILHFYWLLFSCFVY